MIRSVLMALGLSVIAAAGAGADLEALAKAPSNAVASIVTTPSGATLKAGDTVTFSAEALNKQGQPVTGASFSWSSTPTSVVSITRDGLATARAQGFATITVKTGSKQSKISVTVVPNTGQQYAAITGPVQINGILADDQSVYWTETDINFTRVRKTAKTGGPIFDLAMEPARDKRGVRQAYVHLRQIGDTLYFSRQGIGFLEHWSLFSVPKAGGTATQFLPEDISTRSMSASGWNVCGKFIVVTLHNADKLQLPANTVVGAYDTETHAWSSVIKGGFQDARYFISAADDQFFYFRGLTDGGQTKLLKADPTAGENNFTTLQTTDDIDSQMELNGTTDGANLFIWSNRTGTNKLLCYPVNGGDPVTVAAGTFGSGLATDGTFLYWAKNGTTLVRMLNSGGAVTNLQPRLTQSSTSGPIALDDTKAYCATILSPRNLAIIPVTR